MEGLIPYVYRAIVQYKSGGEAPLGAAWFNDSSSASYIRLPGDSGRFRSSEMKQHFSMPSPPSPVAARQSSVLYRSSSRRRA